MTSQTSKHAKLIGKIIYANLLKQPLKKYKRMIEEVTKSLRAKRSNPELKINKLSKTESCHRKDLISSNVIAQIVKKKKGFGIRYSYEDFNKEYLISKKLFNTLKYKAYRNKSEKEILALLYKMKRINSRNRLTCEVLEGIVEYQKVFLKTGNPIDLSVFNQKELAKSISNTTCNSWISRLTNKLSILTAQGEIIPLKFLFPAQKQINKFFIKKILDNESKLLISGKIKNPYSDEEIKNILASKSKNKPSRWSIGKCRKELGIPNSMKRRNCKYPPISINFSILYPLNSQRINNNAPNSPGIYELNLKTQEVAYPNAFTRVIYIGRSMNIRKRLKDYLTNSNKNHNIRNFVKKHQCLFRYSLLKGNLREEEKKLYKLFLSTYGSAPKCNKVSP